nr:head maturation protease, ClpP-related [Sedimentibacter sp.]
MRQFWNLVKNEDTGENELRIDGPIRMEQGFWDWLFDKPDRSATGLEKAINGMSGNITVWINSPGGEVFAGSVIYTALKNYSKGKVIAKVTEAISAASVIAMAADEILMSPTGLMMIHNPWTLAEGEVKDMQKAIDLLNEVKESILNAYTKKTGLSKAEIAKLMDEETWMSADKAIKMGFADGKLFEEETNPQITNEIIEGAKLVYNSIDKEELAIKLKHYLEKESNNEADNQPKNDEVDFLMLKNQLELEKNRFI